MQAVLGAVRRLGPRADHRRRSRFNPGGVPIHGSLRFRKVLRKLSLPVIVLQHGRMSHGLRDSILIQIKVDGRRDLPVARDLVRLDCDAGDRNGGNRNGAWHRYRDDAARKPGRERPSKRNTAFSAAMILPLSNASTAEEIRFLAFQSRCRHRHRFAGTVIVSPQIGEPLAATRSNFARLSPPRSRPVA